ncbi:MAG: DegT/DnrJ/EryC1/StrS family aminotransferase, partial [Armatimonadota bacterium]
DAAIRDALIASLGTRGIGCRAYFTPPCHRHIGSAANAALPQTDRAAASTLAIPAGPQLCPDRAFAMCGEIVDQFRRLRKPIHAMSSFPELKSA